MFEKSIGAIFAVTEDGVMGNGLALPWPKGHVKGDLPHFKRVTTDCVIIQGRSTLESLGFKPLPNRKNYVVSTTLEDDIDGVTVFNSIASALGSAVLHNKPIWFIGGSNLLEQVMQMDVLDRLWITRVHEEFSGDVVLEWDADFLYDKGFVRTSHVEISDGKASIEHWGRVV